MAFVVSQKMDAIERVGSYSINTYTITDQSNYVSEGLDVNDYVGIIKIVYAGKTIYENTDYSNPDITVGLGSKTFPLVLDADGDVRLGTYVVTLSMRNKDTLAVTTNSTTYVYGYTAITLSISLTADGFNSTLTSQDITSYGTLSVSRTHTLTVPVGSGLSDQTSTSSTISLPANIWSGTYVTTLTNIVTYTNGSLTVTDTITESETLMVYNLSRDTVFGAVSDFNDLYNETIGVNPKLSVEYGVLSNRINGYLREYQNGVEENSGTKCYNALTDICQLLSPDFIDDLFVSTEEIIPYDFRVSTDAEALAFIQSLTATSAEINTLHGLTVSGNRVIYTNGTKLTSKSDFTFDGEDLSIPDTGDFLIGDETIQEKLRSEDGTWTGDNTFENLVSPIMTGTPTAPTAAADTNTTQVATTAFVVGQAGDDAPLMDGSANAGTSKKYSREDHIHPTDTTKAPIDSPTFTGDPKAPTPSKTDNDTSIATTAFVKTVVADYAPLESPALTGNPTCPTQELGDESTKVANTEFVANAVFSTKGELGLYQDSMNLQPCVIRNSFMDNTLPTNGRQIFPKLTSGAFTSAMVGRRFTCTNAGSATSDFTDSDGNSLIRYLTASTYIATDVPAGIPLVLNTVYTVIKAGTPNNWGSTELTPIDTIEADKWYIVKDNSVTYNGTVYAASVYNPYAVNFQDGENITPSLFVGNSSATTFTGTGNVYEFNGIVVTGSTGNGTTSGTITLNWVPNLYNLFTPTTGEEWALKAIKPRYKTLKITGGNYINKTLNFVVSGSGGYTLFNSSDFALGSVVSLYNPFNSSFDINFTSKLLPTPKPTFASLYIVASGLFKRKTDNYHCGLFYGVANNFETSDGKRGRVGAYTTEDFTSLTYVNNSKQLFDGKLLDYYISTGTLTSGSKYKIIATQTNHFGSGKAVGDYFISAGTETCDANNIVRPVDMRWRFTGVVSNPWYMGQDNQGRYIWEASIILISPPSASLSTTFETTTAFVKFDETFADDCIKFREIEMPAWIGDTTDANTKFYSYPNYIFYGGKHRIYVFSATDNISTHPYVTYEYISENGKYGPYTTRNVFHTRDITNDAYPCSRDIEIVYPFIYNAKLYALTAGTSISSYCGFDANKREYSLFRYSDTDDEWLLDSRSPVIINPINATSTLWGTNCEWAKVHSSLISYYIDGGILRMNYTAEKSTDTYDICYGELDLRVLAQ